MTCSSTASIIYIDKSLHNQGLIRYNTWQMPPMTLHLGHMHHQFFHMQGTFVLSADHTDKNDGPSITTSCHEQLIEAPEIPITCLILHATIQQKAVH